MGQLGRAAEQGADERGACLLDRGVEDGSRLRQAIAAGRRQHQGVVLGEEGAETGG